ncbi:MAG: hypothetical protein LBS86_03450 [Treponema sp.]|jgi:hypothetical protein|nr:hypothetical protein [Treponema sp.]
MAGPLNAKVILARCSKTRKTFGIRIEERRGDWVRTWAFPLDERKAKREGFDAETVTGSMNEDDEYPGCPHCGAAGFVSCGCGKISCNGGVTDHGDGSAEFTCPWCKEYRDLYIGDNFEVSSGGY